MRWCVRARVKSTPPSGTGWRANYDRETFNNNNNNILDDLYIIILLYNILRELLSVCFYVRRTRVHCFVLPRSVDSEPIGRCRGDRISDFSADLPQQLSSELRYIYENNKKNNNNRDNKYIFASSTYKEYRHLYSTIIFFFFYYFFATAGTATHRRRFKTRRDKHFSTLSVSCQYIISRTSLLRLTHFPATYMPVRTRI